MDLQKRLNKIYIFNLRYILHNDINRIILATIDLKDFESSKVNNVITLIHPVYAIMLSFSKGDKSLYKNIKEVPEYFNITYKEAYTFFNKNLILGNILENSILDVWNSPKAKNLFFISQSIFPKESPCSKCTEFKQCRYDLGVCWTDSMAAYGEENWLFPTPDCPYATHPKNIINVW